MFPNKWKFEETTRFPPVTLTKKGKFFMKTNVCHKNFNSSKNWVSAFGHSRIHFCHGFGNTYGNLFHYAGNNPVRYIDPDGRKINLSNTRKENYDAILFIINQMSILQYKITNDGKLEIDAGTLNRNGSETFNRDMLYAFCSSFDIYIFFLNIDYNGYDVIGGTTYFYENEKKVDIIITIDNYPTMKGKNGNYYVPSTKRLFAHELSGHAVPEIKNENGNAVSIENEICRQMNWIEREEEPDHASF